MESVVLASFIFTYTPNVAQWEAFGINLILHTVLISYMNLHKIFNISGHPFPEIPGLAQNRG